MISFRCQRHCSVCRYEINLMIKTGPLDGTLKHWSTNTDLVFSSIEIFRRMSIAMNLKCCCFLLSVLTFTCSAQNEYEQANHNQVRCFSFFNHFRRVAKLEMVSVVWTDSDEWFIAPGDDRYPAPSYGTVRYQRHRQSPRFGSFAAVDETYDGSIQRAATSSTGATTEMAVAESY